MIIIIITTGTRLLPVASYEGIGPVYCPLDSFQTEVEDLWYERRKGPSSADLRRAKVWNSTLPARGQYSALCHASFANAFYRLDVHYPRPFYHYGDMVSREGNAYTIQDHIDKTTRRELSYYIWLVDEKRGEYPRMYDISCDVHGVNRVASVYLTLYEYRPYYKPGYWYDAYRITYGKHAIPLDDFVAWDASWLIMQGLSLLPDNPTGFQYTTYIPEYKIVNVQSPDAAYVKVRAENALSSALRYRDTELVDWSVDALAYNITPYALGDIDIITGKAKAFVDATDDIPLLSENSLQNIASAFSVLRSFAFGAEETSKFFDAVTKAELPRDWYTTNARGRTRAQQRAYQRMLNKAALRTTLYSEDGKLLDTAGDAWLKGRYAFSTSVSDLGQAWDYFYDLALQNIGKRSSEYKCHGKDTTDTITLQCTFTAQERALTGLTKAFEFCYRNGLEPNAYVLWDFVPFSFVVDWFVPIGDALNAYTRASHFVPEYWEFKDVYDGKAFCYSVSYDSDTAFGPVHVYTRWYEPSPPEVEAAYFLKRSSHVGDSTLCKRVLDGIALFHP